MPYVPPSPLLSALVWPAVKILMGKKSGLGTEIAGRQGPVALRLSAFPSNIRFHFMSLDLTALFHVLPVLEMVLRDRQDDVALVWTVTLTSQAELIYIWNSQIMSQCLQSVALRRHILGHLSSFWAVMAIILGVGSRQNYGQLWSDLF